MTEGIRESSYEPGVWFVPPEPGTTQQSIGSQQWKVGNRYTLKKVLGYGSFSAVCLAVDNATGEQVALKRIGDVLHSPEQAKRVLREICILRRLSHPNVVGLRDVFVRPAATGQCRLVRGQLVHISIDVYIAMEYADGGDLFHLRGQLSEEEVKSLMWQMGTTLRWLHSLHVWHRDLKTQNIFLRLRSVDSRGAITILSLQFGDFGSARSAIPEGYEYAEQAPPDAWRSRPSSGQGPHEQSEKTDMSKVDSYRQMQEEMQPEDLYVRFETSSIGGHTGFKAPLTRVVATPCYRHAVPAHASSVATRAPEVVMSRGGYTSSIDMWSLGCIFGELLSRIAHVGSAATPNLQVAPLFAIHGGMPKTPGDDESYLCPPPGNPGCETTRRELQALFDVIGTPTWADVAEVQEHSWRQYLHRLPGKAPNLYRRRALFYATGDAAVDLLTRLLAFDPSRRASAKEMLAHEYFSDLQTEESTPVDERLATTPLSGAGLPRPRSSERAGLPPLPPRQRSGGDLQQRRAGPAATAAAAVGAPAATAPALEHEASLSGPFAGVSVASTSFFQPAGGTEQAAVNLEQLASRAPSGDVAMADVAPAASSRDASPLPGGEGGAPPAAGAKSLLAPPGAPWWFREPNPGRALALLELELSSLHITEEANPMDPCAQRLRELLEMEVAAIAQAAGGGLNSPPRSKQKAKVPQPSEQGILRGLLQQKGPGLQVDVALMGSGMVDWGRERMSNVADTQQGRELDPARILGPQRHGEWTAFGQQPKPSPGPAWGVTALPPGADASAMDASAMAAIKRQQMR
eukprot:scaffold13.g345.t1